MKKDAPEDKSYPPYLDRPKVRVPEKATLIAWIARDKDGELDLFDECPYRHLGGFWYSASIRRSSIFILSAACPDAFPSLTWDDEPVQVEVEIRIKKQNKQ